MSKLTTMDKTLMALSKVIDHAIGTKATWAITVVELDGHGKGDVTTLSNREDGLAVIEILEGGIKSVKGEDCEEHVQLRIVEDKSGNMHVSDMSDVPEAS